MAEAIQAPTRSAEGVTAERAAPALLAVLSVCSAGAAAVHFAMVPSHMGDDASQAIAFAIAGWLQLGIAIAAPIRPGRVLYAIAAVSNAVFIAAWGLSRTSGLPFGPHAGVAEAAGFVDQATVVLEVVIVLLAVLLLVRPGLGARWDRSSIVLATLPIVAVVALTTAAVTSTSATDHGGSGGHDHGETASGVYGGDHAHPVALVEPLDMATQAKLSEELELARAATLLYPTVADVKAAGGVQLNKFTPGSGAHYTMPVPGVPVPKGGFNLQAIMGNVKGFDAANPPIVLYSGNEDTSVIVGLMYVVFQDEEPEGFVGGSDIWHRHQGVCAEVKEDGGLNILLPIEIDTTKEQCDAVGGNHMPVTPWMVHVWTAAGWESPQGVFSHENPLLVCSDGTLLDEAYDFSKGCAGLG